MDIPRNQALPWGRTLNEYAGMFKLNDADLRGKILGCADGPASFNAEMTGLGHAVVSVDPLYADARADIASRVAIARETIMADTIAHLEDYVWEDILSVEELEARRLGAVATFLEDYDRGLDEGRYLARALPGLDFSDGAFDLALCSHFLFLYSDQFSAEFHLQSVAELCRVAREVRIFPILDLQGRRSAHLEFVMDKLAALGHSATVENVPYEFQRGAFEMLRVV